MVLNIYTATRDELQTIHGIGPKIADKILNLGATGKIEMEDLVTNTNIPAQTWTDLEKEGKLSLKFVGQAAKGELGEKGMEYLIQQLQQRLSQTENKLFGEIEEARREAKEAKLEAKDFKHQFAKLQSRVNELESESYKSSSVVQGQLMGIEQGLSEAERAYHERNKELEEQFEELRQRNKENYKLPQNELLKERERTGAMHDIEFSPPHLSHLYQSTESDADEDNCQIESQDCHQQPDDDTLCKPTHSRNEYDPTKSHKSLMGKLAGKFPFTGIYKPIKSEQPSVGSSSVPIKHESAEAYHVNMDSYPQGPHYGSRHANHQGKDFFSS